METKEGGRQTSWGRTYSLLWGAQVGRQEGILGFGRRTHPLPPAPRPGPWAARGVVLGQQNLGRARLVTQTPEHSLCWGGVPRRATEADVEPGESLRGGDGSRSWAIGSLIRGWEWTQCGAPCPV